MTAASCTASTSTRRRGSAPRRSPRTSPSSATRAKALPDPTRLALAHALRAADELCVCDLPWISGRAENLVSHHPRALRGAGLAASRRDGKMVLYRLSDAGRALLEAAARTGDTGVS
jgi:DNA-binding transcriptional ArsR family regulator